MNADLFSHARTEVLPDPVQGLQLPSSAMKLAKDGPIPLRVFLVVKFDLDVGANRGNGYQLS